jgi:hypothetical protein
VPHRLGAALTYARRYGLFTLVGIAGEDDLDAPDLPAAKLTTEAQTRGEGRLGTPAIEPKPSKPQRVARAERIQPPALPPDAASNLRQQLTAELAALNEVEALAGWAHRVLPLKNRLPTTEAESIEIAFQAKLSQLSDATPAEPLVNDTNGHASQASCAEPEGVIAISKPVRERDRDHLRFVASQPCLVCGRTPSDPHHIKFAEQRAMGRKVSDKFTVPICRLHHRELHRRGNERRWWETKGIDPLPIAASLWACTHAVEPAAAGEPEKLTKLNGKPSAIGHPNNETKPIVRPEAG